MAKKTTQKNKKIDLKVMDEAKQEQAQESSGPTTRTGIGGYAGRPYPPQDQWADKFMFCCRTCRFYVEKEYAQMIGKLVGRCRFNPPTRSGYPVVFPTDFCGQHKLGNSPRS